MRLIDADKLKAEGYTLHRIYKTDPHTSVYENIPLDDVPTIDAEPVRHGRWIEKEGYDGDTYYDCSVCSESWTTIEGTPWDNGMAYCPNCGARMEEQE